MTYKDETYRQGTEKVMLSLITVPNQELITVLIDRFTDKIIS